MKLNNFRIQNYKSIKDSGVCYLSENDNILVLAGQNESGKSSILQALADFYSGELHPYAMRKFDSTTFFPSMDCTFNVDGGNLDINQILKDLDLPEEMGEYFRKLDKFIIIRVFTSQTESILRVDDNTHNEFITAIKKINEKTRKNKPPSKTEGQEEEEGGEGINEIKLIDEELSKEDLGDILFSYTTKIIFFDDLRNLLPEKIYISSLINNETDVDGYIAVKNIETILGEDFTKFSELEDGVRESRRETCNRTITADFNEKWKQQIFSDSKTKISIQFNQGGQNDKGPYLNFFIVTKENEYLIPQQRSQGFRWFLSFYLRLKAESKANDRLIILFDEPGLFLHSKAQNDMKNLFEELAQKDQIIYSTHSPYLIDSDHLNRVRLILNDKDDGTKIEKITAKISDNQQDALKPIADAVGLDIAHCFSLISKKNVIVEGISDFYYFVAMKKILGINDDFSFIPSVGATQVHLLMELCIGWGLSWLIIFDDDSQSNNAYRNIKKNFFNNKEDDVKKKIYLTKDIDGVENMFKPEDLNLVDASANFNNSEKNSVHVKTVGGKELYSRLFFEKANNGEIKKAQLSRESIAHFQKSFDFIQANLI